MNGGTFEICWPHYGVFATFVREEWKDMIGVD